MERCGLRLQLMKQQALAGDIVLLFADESEALTHPYLARAWAKRGADLRIEAPGQSEKIALMGALDFISRELIVETSQTKRSSDVIALLERLDYIYGPKPGTPCKPVTIALDNGPVHTSKATQHSTGRARALAHTRMAGKIRARAKRHRTPMENLQGSSSRPQNLQEPGQPESRNQCRNPRHQFNPEITTVG